MRLIPKSEIHTPNVQEKWKRLLLAWENYALATELTKKAEGVQVATLLTVIGEEAREVYATFNDWENDGDEKTMKPVLKKFEEYCESRKNVPFERFKFNLKCKSPGKPTISTAQRCESEPIVAITRKSPQKR